jgi:hypothetical protein
MTRCFWLGPFVVLTLSACGGDNLPDDDGCNGPECQGNNPTVLKSTIGLDLANVASFAVIDPDATRSLKSITADQGGGSQLFAITLSGEVLEVTMVELEDPQPGAIFAEPLVFDIFPTATWILFSTVGFAVNVRQADESLAPVECNMIAARRADGALYCSSLGFMSNPNADGRYDQIHANAAGDVVYAAAHDPNFPDKGVIYKLNLGGAEGPSAELAIDASIYPQWFLTNAVGDLFVVYYQSALDQTTRLAQIVPAGGGSPVVLAQPGYETSAHGEFGGPDGNAFYAENQNGGAVDETTVWVITADGASFVETPQTVSFANASMYNMMFRLGGGVYKVSTFEKGIVQVLENGVAVASATPVLFNGVDHFVSVRGSLVQAGLEQVVIFASTGSGYEFIRHDGTTQQDIPIDAALDVTDYKVAPSGAIDFWARRMDTQEKVHGEVAPGATEVTVTSGGTIDPAQAVVFTRIN